MNVTYANFLMDKIDFPEEAKKFYVAHMDKIISDGNESVIDAIVEDYVRDVNTDDIDNRLIVLLKSHGYSVYSTWILVLLLGAEKVKAKYDARGVSDEVFYDTFCDIKYKLMECMDIYGKWGTFVAGWYRHFFNCELIKFGRLEYEDNVYNRDEPYVLGDVVIKKGDRMLGIHIPSSGEPFTLEERLKSYKMAYDFYTREKGSKYLVCDCGSWLLYPEYQNVFPEGGAKDFYSDFDMLFSCDENEFGDAWRVFGNISDKKFEDYPEDTRMRRAFKRHLLEGGKNGYGMGMLVFDGERLLTRTDK